MATLWKLLALWVVADMKIFVNSKAFEVEPNSKVCDILPGYDVFVRNGYGIDKNSLLAEDSLP